MNYQTVWSTPYMSDMYGSYMHMGYNTINTEQEPTDWDQLYDGCHSSANRKIDDNIFPQYMPNSNSTYISDVLRVNGNDLTTNDICGLYNKYRTDNAENGKSVIDDKKDCQSEVTADGYIEQLNDSINNIGENNSPLSKASTYEEPTSGNYCEVDTLNSTQENNDQKPVDDLSKSSVQGLENIYQDKNVSDHIHLQGLNMMDTNPYNYTSYVSGNIHDNWIPNIEVPFNNTINTQGICEKGWFRNCYYPSYASMNVVNNNNITQLDDQFNKNISYNMIPDIYTNRYMYGTSNISEGTKNCMYSGVYPSIPVTTKRNLNDSGGYMNTTLDGYKHLDNVPECNGFIESQHDSYNNSFKLQQINPNLPLSKHYYNNQTNYQSFAAPTYANSCNDVKAENTNEDDLEGAIYKGTIKKIDMANIDFIGMSDNVWQALRGAGMFKLGNKGRAILKSKISKHLKMYPEMRMRASCISGVRRATTRQLFQLAQQHKTDSIINVKFDNMITKSEEFQDISITEPNLRSIIKEHEDSYGLELDDEPCNTIDVNIIGAKPTSAGKGIQIIKQGEPLVKSILEDSPINMKIGSFLDNYLPRKRIPNIPSEIYDKLYGVPGNNIFTYDIERPKQHKIVPIHIEDGMIPTEDSTNIYHHIKRINTLLRGSLDQSLLPRETITNTGGKRVLNKAYISHLSDGFVSNDGVDIYGEYVNPEIRGKMGANLIPLTNGRVPRRRQFNFEDTEKLCVKNVIENANYNDDDSI